MRPRHKAAENDLTRFTATIAQLASMRPRHKAAENGDQAPVDAEAARASMRPRHKAAENRCAATSSSPWCSCFNEAAA